MYINNIDKQERLYNHLYKTQSNFRVLCDSVRALPESKHLDLPAYLAKVPVRLSRVTPPPGGLMPLAERADVLLVLVLSANAAHL
jgi:hypothetical protein